MKKVTTRLKLESLDDRIVPSSTTVRPDNPGLVNSIHLADGSFQGGLDTSSPRLGDYDTTILRDSAGSGTRDSGVVNAIFIDDGSFVGGVDTSNPSSGGFDSTVLYDSAGSGTRNSGVVNAIFIDDGSFDGSLDKSNPPLGGFAGTTLYVSEGEGPSGSQPGSRFGAGWSDFWDEMGNADNYRRVARGFGNVAVELGQMGRDVGNSAISLGSHVPNYFFDTGVYGYDFHSQLIGGYSKADYSNRPSSPGNYQSPEAAEIQFRAMRSAATLGMYDLVVGGFEAEETKNYGKFQEETGGFLFGAILPYAPGAARGIGRAATNVGREAGPFLNPGNYRLNPNSLQSFPSVPLEFNGPTFTRPGGAGPVPLGPEGPTVIQ